MKIKYEIRNNYMYIYITPPPLKRKLNKMKLSEVCTWHELCNTKILKN